MAPLRRGPTASRSRHSRPPLGEPARARHAQTTYYGVNGWTARARRKRAVHRASPFGAYDPPSLTVLPYTSAPCPRPFLIRSPQVAPP